jgi:hypothetical protein
MEVDERVLWSTKIIKRKTAFAGESRMESEYIKQLLFGNETRDNFGASGSDNWRKLVDFRRQ